MKQVRVAAFASEPSRRHRIVVVADRRHAFDVPVFARADHVRDLPLSHWTRVVFGRVGFVVLGDVHGRTTAEVCALPGVNVAMLDELLTVLDDVRRAGPTLRAPLLDVLDAAIERLDPQLGSVLLHRHGGTGEAPPSFAETATRCGVGTGERARRLELRAVGELRRLAGPAFCRVLRKLEDGGGSRGRELLAAEMKRRRNGNKRLPWGGIQAFYVRLFLRLDACKIASQGLSCGDDGG